MSYPLGTKIRLIQSWRTYSVGAVLEQGYAADLEQLVRTCIAVKVEETEGAAGRPAKLARKAADKLTQAGRDLLGK